VFFSKPIGELPKVPAPTAAGICARSKPSAEGKALLTPGMTPGQYLTALDKNKRPVDSVHFLAHGLPEKDSICWAAQSSRLVAPKLSAPELHSLQLTEAWLKDPRPDLRASIAASLGKVDFTGPGSWTAQAALWAAVPGVPPIPPVPGMPAVPLVAAAVAGAILLSAGLMIGPAMPPIPQPKLALPMVPLPPEMLLQLQQPNLAAPNLAAPDQLKLVKPLAPFLELGFGVGRGTVKCC
jgi:hypothetical protein